jgi:hypothetical protein
MTLLEHFQVEKLNERIKNDKSFKEWIIEEWNALYNDIINGTGLYPYFYTTIESEYAAR